jgi:hypothetical protein
VKQKLYQITLHTSGHGVTGFLAAIDEMRALVEARKDHFRTTTGIDNRYWGKHMTATIRQYANYHHGSLVNERLAKDKKTGR